MHWSKHGQFTSSRLVWHFYQVNGQSIGSLESAPSFHWLSLRLFISQFNGPSAKSMVSTSVHWIFRLYFASSCVDCPSAKSKACQSSQLSALQFIGLNHRQFTSSHLDWYTFDKSMVSPSVHWIVRRHFTDFRVDYSSVNSLVRPPGLWPALLFTGYSAFISLVAASIVLPPSPRFVKLVVSS